MNISNIDATTLRRWLSNDEAILIDVREPVEYSAAHIVEAKNIPLGQLPSHLPIDCGGKKLVFHCRSGGRSQQACQVFAKNHPDAPVFNLDGGLLSWETNGLDVLRSGKDVLPLDRQVQLTIGLLLIAFSVLSYFISPTFIILLGLLGVGLSIAGVTGYCGLAILMAKMPWNQIAATDISSVKAK